MTRMTREEAAEILDGRNIVDRAAYLEALEVAANALCESAALRADAPPPNGPLTMEELREMAETHEPVWCTHKNGYVFIATTKTEPYNQVWFFNHKGFWDTVLYYHTKFYRRRPEEGTV